MMGCFSTSQTDGTEESFRMSLRSLLANKETPIPAPSLAKKIIERKLGLGTRKTLQARTNMLDTACHSLAKAQQRSLGASLTPAYYIKSEILLFPLPLPPGYKPTAAKNSKPCTKRISGSSRKLLTAANSSSGRVKNVGVDRKDSNSGSAVSKKTSDDFSGDFSIRSSNSSCSPANSSPNSPTSSSSVFSAATSRCLSQSSSFNSSSTISIDLLQCNSLSYAKCNCPKTVGSPLKEFSPIEIAIALKNSGQSQKLADGAMGPFYKILLPAEKSHGAVAITKLPTKLTRKRWRTQVQALAQLAHCNLSKVKGFSYERVKYVNGMEDNDNLGFIVYEDIGDESLEDFLRDVEKGIDWLIRLKLAIGIVEGLSFLLENMPAHVDYGNLTLRNIRVDFALNAKLFDFILLSTNTGDLKEKRLCNVVQSLGNVLIQLFDFVSHSSNVEAQDFREILHYKRSYPQNDAKLVADLAISCLHPEGFSRPSLLKVARILRSIEPTQHVVAEAPVKQSKPCKRRSLSFG